MGNLSQEKAQLVQGRYMITKAICDMFCNSLPFNISYNITKGSDYTITFILQDNNTYTTMSTWIEDLDCDGCDYAEHVILSITDCLVNIPVLEDKKLSTLISNKRILNLM